MSPKMIDSAAIVPLVPLDQKSTYTVAILKGVMTADGKPYGPSPIWTLVRQKTNPVTLDDQGNVIGNQTPLDPSDPAQLAQIKGLDLVWKASAQALAFLDANGHSDRAEILLAWEFTTQTTTDPLDPAKAGSPATMLSMNKLVDLFSVPTMRGVPCSAGAGCTAFLTASGVPCGAIPCSAVGDILATALGATNFQADTPNSFNTNKPIPGSWSDPVQPMRQNSATLVAIISVPKCPGAQGCVGSSPPATGWPTIVFGHGLGSSKESLAVFAPQLAAAGFQSVAIDFQAHGSRAVRTSNAAAIGCAGHCSVTTTMACDGDSANCPGTETCNNGVGIAISPTTTQQCYAPFLSSDLAVTRDNIRQTVLDLQNLVKYLKACGATGCTNGPLHLSVDPAKISYAGISLGGIIGSTTTATAPDIKAAVLNVSGVGWVDILENTQTFSISCLLVDSLIDAGVLMGDKWNGSETAPTGLCATTAWQQQPGYQQFRVIARWVLDPADGANFTRWLASRKFLLQEVVGDKVVSNVATDNEGKLVGLTPATADPFTPATTTASAAITTMPTMSKWLRYPSLPASDATTGGFGNLFEHPSLLRPAAAPGHCSNNPATQCLDNATCTPGVCVFPGELGTARLQTDAITYLLLNN
jgi:pimeloyl-ACP methyl ester carboxylesterase